MGICVKKLGNYEEYGKFVGEYEMTFLFIYAEWCKPCEEFKPILMKYVEERYFPENIGFGMIDYDQLKKDQEWFQLFQKISLPAFYSYHLNVYDKPIISVDLIFIHPFIEGKLYEIMEKRKLTIVDDF